MNTPARRRLCTSAAVVVAMAAASAAHAQMPRLDISGFGTLAATRTSSAGIAYKAYNQPPEAARADTWAFDTDSRLGLQLKIDPTQTVSLVTQVIAMHGHDGNIDPALEWAYLSVDLTSALELRLGRVQTPTFVDSEYRYVGYAYTSVRPLPQLLSFYPLSQRHDGLNLHWEGGGNGRQITVSAFYGRSSYRLADDNQGRPFQYRARNMFGGTVTWEDERFLLHAAYLHMRARAAGSNPEETLGFIAPYLDGVAVQVCPSCPEEARNWDRYLSGFGFQLGTVGGAATIGPWSFGLDLFLEANTGVLADAFGWSAMASRQFGNVMPYVFHNHLRTLSNNAGPFDADGNSLLDMLNGFYESRRVDRDSIGAGLRWDVLEDVALKAELEYFMFQSDHHSARLTFPRGPGPDKPRRFALFTFALEFVF